MWRGCTPLPSQHLCCWPAWSWVSAFMSGGFYEVGLSCMMPYFLDILCAEQERRAGCSGAGIGGVGGRASRVVRLAERAAELSSCCGAHAVAVCISAWPESASLPLHPTRFTHCPFLAAATPPPADVQSDSLSPGQDILYTILAALLAWSSWSERRAL